MKYMRNGEEKWEKNFILKQNVYIPDGSQKKVSRE